MKRIFILGCLTLIAICITDASLEARGGRGGGFRGGGSVGGGARGASQGRMGGRDMNRGNFNRSAGDLGRGNVNRGAGNYGRNYAGNRNPASNFSYNRVPSFTPSDIRPSTSAFSGEQTARPNNLSSLAQGRDSGRNMTQQQLQNFLTGNQGVGNAAGAVAANAPAATNLASSLSNRAQLGDSIRHNVGDNLPNNGAWFKGAFWGSHANRWDWNTGADWWAYPSYGGAASWLGWNAANPAYYDNGSAYYPSSTTSTPSTSQTTASQPTQQGGSSQTQIASGDWMPMGVYALTKEGNSSVTPTMYMQLAMNKNGKLAGTYYNSSTDTTHPLEGLADPNTQQVALKMSDNDRSPILQTGLYNLTQDQTPVQVNFADGSTQDWFLVRMNQPQNAAG